MSALPVLLMSSRQLKASMRYQPTTHSLSAQLSRRGLAHQRDLMQESCPILFELARRDYTDKAVWSDSYFSVCLYAVAPSVFHVDVTRRAYFGGKTTRSFRSIPAAMEFLQTLTPRAQR